jgi:hypothetical protein
MAVGVLWWRSRLGFRNFYCWGCNVAIGIGIQIFGRNLNAFAERWNKQVESFV